MKDYIDANAFREMILSASAALNAESDLINELNVFPVPDGDTGTNMSLTMKAAADEMAKHSYSEISAAADRAAGALLRGARGNSGVILSLLFRGVSRRFKGLETAGTKEFAGALNDGVDTAYKAVMKPSEGTILTVSRLASKAAAEAAELGADIVIYGHTHVPGVEYDEEKDLYIYHTGLAFESNFNIGQFLFARSSNRKTDAYLCNGVGIADSAIYRGEIQFCFKNRDSLETVSTIAALQKALLLCGNDTVTKQAMFTQTKEDYIRRARNLEFAPYRLGDRIGQMVFMGYPNVEIEVVDELSDSSRGTNGFGSSGN